MAATDPHSPTSPHVHVNGFRPAMSEEEALQIQRDAYVLANAKKEADEQRRALHAQATNTRGVSEEEKRRRILAYMYVPGYRLKILAYNFVGHLRAIQMTMTTTIIWTMTTTKTVAIYLESMKTENWTWRRMSMGWVVSFK